MKKHFTCIICPRGCDIEASIEEDGKVVTTGYGCKRGIAYVEGEIHHPVRTIASSVVVEGGELPLVSVRLTKPVAKTALMPVMKEIYQAKMQAPVHIGDIVIENVLGLESDVVATKNVQRK